MCRENKRKKGDREAPDWNPFASSFIYHEISEFFKIYGTMSEKES